MRLTSRCCSLDEALLTDEDCTNLRPSLSSLRTARDTTQRTVNVAGPTRSFAAPSQHGRWFAEGDCVDRLLEGVVTKRGQLRTDREDDTHCVMPDDTPKGEAQPVLG